MRERAGIGVMISAMALTALGSSSMVAGPADSAEIAKGILDGARRNRLAIPPLSMDVEVTKFKADNDKFTLEVPIERLIKQYRRNGDRLDLVSQRYLPNGSGGFEDGNFTGRSIWDGRRALHRQGGRHVYGFVSKSDELSRRILFSEDGGGILDGCIPHNLFEGDWTQVLAEQLPRVLVRSQTVAVNDHVCQVLETDTRHGTYTLWVDVASGGCLRQAIVRLDKDDLAWGQPLRQSYVFEGHGKKRCYESLEMTLTDVVVERIGELFLPVAGTYICRARYDDGYEMTLRRTITRRNVVFHPDFEAMGAFQMDMPEGTIVFDQDVPGVRYQWFQGGLVPYLREVMDEGIAALDDHQPVPVKTVPPADAHVPHAETRRGNLTATAAEQPQARGGLPWELLLAAMVVVGIALGFAWTRTNKDASREQEGEV